MHPARHTSIPAAAAAHTYTPLRLHANHDQDDDTPQQVFKLPPPDDVEVVGLLNWEREPRGRRRGRGRGQGEGEREGGGGGYSGDTTNHVERRRSDDIDGNINPRSPSHAPTYPPPNTSSHPHPHHPPHPRPRSGSGLGMGMQSTPPGSIVLARNRTRSFGHDLVGMSAADVGGDDAKRRIGFGFGIPPSRTSTPILQQRKRLSLKLSRSYKTMTTLQYSTGRLPIQDGDTTTSSTGDGDVMFDWDGEEMDIEMPIGLNDNHKQSVRRQPVTSDYSPPSFMRFAVDDVAASKDRVGRRKDFTVRGPVQRSRVSDGQTGTTTRSTVPTVVESFVVPLNDATDGDDDDVEHRYQHSPRQADVVDAADHMNTSDRTTQPPGTRICSSISSIDPIDSILPTKRNNRLRTNLPPLPSVSLRDLPPVTPPGPGQRMFATHRRRDSVDDDDPRFKQRMRIVGPSSELAQTPMNHEMISGGDSFDEIPKTHGKVPPTRAGVWTTTALPSSERYGLGTFDETDGSKSRTIIERIDEQEADDTNDNTLEQPRRRSANDEQRIVMPFSPKRQYEQQDEDGDDMNDLAPRAFNDDDDDDDDTPPKTTQQTYTRNDQLSEDISPRPIAANTAPQRHPFSHLPTLFNLPPLSPLSFSMTISATPSIEPTSFRRVWNDTYPDVVIPREMDMDRVPGKVDKGRKRAATATAATMDSDDENENSERGELGERRIMQREKRAKCDHDEPDPDDDRRREDRLRRIAFFKDLDENYELVVEWVI